MERIRVLIVDDEPPARAKVRRFAQAAPGVEVVGEAASGPEAADAISALGPDLVFLDVQMPGMDGFATLDALAGRELPEVVFVTAFDEFAVRAFEVHAVDYLLKPFDQPRFARALERARERLAARRAGGVDERLRHLVAGARPLPLERLLVPAGGRSVVLATASIDWLEAEQNYVRLHVGATSYLMRGTLAGLEARLDPARFVRIHRSRIVNADRVREIHPWSHGDQRVILHDGTELLMSRRFRDRWAGL